jgi:hypothetical protein
MKLSDFVTHANKLPEPVGIIENYLAELTLEEVRTLRALVLMRKQFQSENVAVGTNLGSLR